MCDCGEYRDISSTLFGEMCWECRSKMGFTKACSCGTWFEPHDGLYPHLCGVCAFPLERADHEEFERERDDKIRMEMADEKADDDRESFYADH